jgi:hypothetical protein
MIKPGATAVVVNGWTDPFLMRISMWMVKLVEKWGRRVAQERGNSVDGGNTSSIEKKTAKGTFIAKLTSRWLKEQIGKEIPYRIYCWRSVNVRFLRAFIHEKTAGKFFLKVLYWKEEILPGFFGKVGQYPLIVISKENKS